MEASRCHLARAFLLWIALRMWEKRTISPTFSCPHHHTSILPYTQIPWHNILHFIIDLQPYCLMFFVLTMYLFVGPSLIHQLARDKTQDGPLFSTRYVSRVVFACHLNPFLRSLRLYLGSFHSFATSFSDFVSAAPSLATSFNLLHNPHVPTITIRKLFSRYQHFSRSLSSHHSTSMKIYNASIDPHHGRPGSIQ